MDIDFYRLGRAHGQELAALARKMQRQGYGAEAWRDFRVHRLAALADDLRADGATEVDVRTWAQACHEAYDRELNAVIRVYNDAASLMAMQAQGRA